MEARESGAENSAGISSAELLAECETILLAIVAEGGSRDKAIVHAPGGAENPGKDVYAALRYLKQLHRTHAVLVGHSIDGTPRPRNTARVDTAISAALADKGAPVMCADGVERRVYPKSFHALEFLDFLDRQHRLDAEAATISAQLLTREDLAVYALAPLETSLARRVWLWVLTAKGAELPFDDADSIPEPPKWTKRATPEDILKFFEAHLEVHQQRLSIISTAFPSETNGSQSRLPLAGFIGAIAAEHGQDANVLMRHRSIGNLFATSVTAAEGAREAQRRAVEKGA